LSAEHFDRAALRKRWGLDANTPTVVFCGRFMEQKRPEFLADILAAVDALGIRFQALILGDGPLKPMFKRCLRAHRLSAKVSILGNVPHRDWLAALSISDVFLLPSMYEGISIALQEAMYMGVVPVTCAVGGQGEIVTADSGYLITQDEAEKASYVSAVAGLLKDPALRARLGQGARARIEERFSQDGATRKLMAALEKATTLAAKSPRGVVAEAFGRELATLAIEYLRLKSVADSAWGQLQSDKRSRRAANLARSVKHRLLLLSSYLLSTPAGKTVLRTHFVRVAGKALLRWLDGVVAG
jgi:hypothetical protein